MLRELSVDQLIAEVDSSSPAPGGGSVSALVGSLGCALARMYGHLSIGKKSFEAHNSGTKQRFLEAFDHLASIEDELLHLVEEDTLIFQRFMQATKLPKTTEQEIIVRNKTLEITTKAAIESPLRMIDLCYDGMKELEAMVGYGNRNAISDAGTAIACFEACAKGAYLNVIINLPGLHDSELAYVYERKAKMKLDQILKTSYDYGVMIRAKLLESI